MNVIKLHCTFCKKRFVRTNGRLNEAKKFGWKSYCSLLCQHKALSRQKEVLCARLGCDNIFCRAPHGIRSVNVYCSQSCAAIVNNSRYPKRKALISRCANCHRDFKGRHPYCSRDCKYKAQIITKEEIRKRIRNFYKLHKRIPLKIEFVHYGAAQDRFGSWNNAIVAAGFDPNPVKFSKRYLAEDGHVCDSFAEKIIDDWLTKKGIIHKRSVPYPDWERLTADFVVGRRRIEFFGLAGEMKDYDRLISKKRRICEKYNIPLTEVYPKDLFPTNQLEKVLGV